MSARIARVALSLIAVVAVLRDSPAAGAENVVVRLATPRGASQPFLLITPPQPRAAVILLAGGHGALGLKSATTMTWGAQNFLVRSRDRLAAAGFMVAVADAPSDRPGGMNAIFRMGRAHAQDIAVIAADLKKRAALPVWVIGTSMGTFSAANAAIASSGIDGLVLTSTITRAKANWNIADSHRHGVASMALAQVKVPTLLLAHRRDGCDLTPAADVPRLRSRLTGAARVEAVILDGGDPARSEPCQALSEHGFLGIEDKAVGAIAAFIDAGAR